MTNEEKAQEIARSCFSKRTVDLPVNKLEQIIIKDACLKAMAWKEEQMTKNAIDFLTRILSCTDGFLEEFKSAMQGEWLCQL